MPKLAENKPAETPAKANTPFFNKGEGSALSLTENEQPFFTKQADRPIQTKLTIGQPNDKYEKEADAVADKVIQRLATPEVSNSNEATVQTKPLVSAITPIVQMNCVSCEPEEKLQKKDKDLVEESSLELQRKPIFESNAEPPDDEKNVQRKCTSCEHEEKLQKKSEASESSASSSGIESNLSSTKGSGSPLPSSTKEQMENSIGADFSGVRIHNDSSAVQMNNDLNAQAFTHGNNIYFNSGKYDTSSSEGKHLLAHELTHTIQQGASVHRKENPVQTDAEIQKKPAPTKPVSSQVVDISKGTFNPSETVKNEIDDEKSKGGLDVRIKAGAIAGEGIIKVKKNKDAYNSVGLAYLPLLNPWLQKISMLALCIDIKNNQVSGVVTIPNKGKNKAVWLTSIKNAEEKIGKGLHFSKIPSEKDIINKFENGTLALGFKDFTVILGGFFNLKLNLELQNMNTPVFDGSATLKLKGAEGAVSVDNKNKGKLGGKGSLAITGYEKFSGSLQAIYDSETGEFDIHGKAAYNNDKLSGSIEFVSTDEETANNFTRDTIKAAGGEGNLQNASPPAFVPAPSGNKKRGLAAVGQLEFHLSKWVAGTVNVIVDGHGHLTVIGKIAPPAEILLFKEKNFPIHIFSVHPTAYYGIPHLANLQVFADITLDAIAILGPAKMNNIEILGTYSTDPAVQKSIGISGSINVSAYAGLILKVKGGAGAELLGHAVKAGICVTANVGVKAYAKARPTIGLREPGEFYISGSLEMVAQPMIDLNGSFYVALETPWWSPLSDGTWPWPILSKQWPLTDPIGFNAILKDYVVGSGNVPEIEFRKPEFDSDKFMTNLVDRELPDKTGGSSTGQSTFKDDGTVTKPVVPDKKKNKEKPAPPNTAPGKKAVPSLLPAKAKPNQQAQKEAMELFRAASDKLKGLKDPVSKADLRARLNEIENAVSGIKFTITLNGDKWEVTSSAKGINNPKHVKYKAILTEADKKADGKKDNIEAALGEITQEGKQKIADGEVTKGEADQIAKDVKRDHPSVIDSITVMDGGENWDFEYVQRAKKSIPKTINQATAASALTPGEMIYVFSTADKEWILCHFEKLERNKDINKDKTKESYTELIHAKPSDTKDTTGTKKSSLLKLVVRADLENIAWKKYSKGTLVANYQQPDARGRATGVSGQFSHPLEPLNKAPVTPVGHISGVHEKSHLLGDRFGGLNTRLNIVPLYPAVNDPKMKLIENKMAKAIHTNSLIHFTITAQYVNPVLIPVSIKIQATGDKGFSVDEPVKNSP